MRIMVFNLPQRQYFCFVFYLCGIEKVLTNMETLASKILPVMGYPEFREKISICFVITSIINDSFADILDTFIGG